ncbi:MAG: MucB/RseB C-terminal domain-containing protein [Anaerolineae bacterium]
MQTAGFSSWARTLSLVIACLMVSAPAGADQFDEASKWLERMSQAMSELDYQGTFVYLQGDDVETMRITHVRDASGVRERLVTVSGPTREIIRDANGVSGLVGAAPDTPAGQPSGSTVFPEFPAEALREARLRYMFELGRQGRIAGHKGQRITILPKDEYRYGYELWLQSDTGLLLRWVLYDSKRKPLARLMFTELRIGPEVDHSELQTSGNPQPLIAPATSAGAGSVKREAPGVEQPTGMPPGFRLAAHSRQGAQGQLEHLVFSDGLATVSVYIEPIDARRGMSEGLSRMGTTNAWIHSDGRHQVTAIGEVPAITVQKMGAAFAARGR